MTQELYTEARQRQLLANIILAYVRDPQEYQLAEIIRFTQSTTPFIKKVSIEDKVKLQGLYKKVNDVIKNSRRDPELIKAGFLVLLQEMGNSAQRLSALAAQKAAPPSEAVRRDLTNIEHVPDYLISILKNNGKVSLANLEACLHTLSIADISYISNIAKSLRFLGVSVSKGLFIDQNSRSEKHHKTKATLLCLKYMDVIAKNLNRYAKSLLDTGNANRLTDTVIYQIIFGFSKLGVAPPEGLYTTLTDALCSRLTQKQNTQITYNALVNILSAVGLLGVTPPPSLINYLCTTFSAENDMMSFNGNRDRACVVYEIARLHYNCLNRNLSDPNVRDLILLLENLVNSPQTLKFLEASVMEQDAHSAGMISSAAIYLAFVTGKENKLTNSWTSYDQSISKTERSIAITLGRIGAHMLPVFSTKNGGYMISYDLRLPHSDKRILMEFDGPDHFCFSYAATGIEAYLNGKTTFQSALVEHELRSRFTEAALANDHADLPEILVRLPITAIVDEGGDVDNSKLAGLIANITKYLDSRPNEASFGVVAINTSGNVVSIHDPVAQLPALASTGSGGLYLPWLAAISPSEDRDHDFASAATVTRQLAL